MKPKNPLILIGVIASTLVAGTAAQASVVTCKPDQLFFRTTQWLNPFGFNYTVTDATGVKSVPVETTVGSDYIPSSVVLPTEGGLLTKSLEVPPGFRIKKVLVCTSFPNQDLQVPGISVGIKQAFRATSIPALMFERMASKAPGCAVYSVAGSIDELGNPGLPVDPRISPTTLVINTPANPLGNITGIGLRLQAISNSPLWTFVPTHQHAYLTGRGQGHNNTVALTSGPTDACDVATPIEFSDLDDTADFTPALPGSPAAAVLKPAKKSKKK